MAVVFWTIAGIVVGLGVGAALHVSDTGAVAAGLIGLAAGLAIGIYATVKTSMVARILRVPGAILDLILDLLQ